MSKVTISVGLGNFLPDTSILNQIFEKENLEFNINFVNWDPLNVNSNEIPDLFFVNGTASEHLKNNFYEIEQNESFNLNNFANCSKLNLINNNNKLIGIPSTIRLPCLFDRSNKLNTTITNLEQLLNLAKSNNLNFIWSINSPVIISILYLFLQNSKISNSNNNYNWQLPSTFDQLNNEILTILRNIVTYSTLEQSNSFFNSNSLIDILIGSSELLLNQSFENNSTTITIKSIPNENNLQSAFVDFFAINKSIDSSKINFALKLLNLITSKSILSQLLQLKSNQNVIPARIDLELNSNISKQLAQLAYSNNVVAFPSLNFTINQLYQSGLLIQRNAQHEAVAAIRCLSADTVVNAKSGHPGMPMGMAPAAYVLWNYFINYDPKEPKWFNRDRWILSNGHGCALQYTMLHLAGFDLSIDDLKRFRQLHSKTPGHPEVGITPGVEATTGPLGQGIGNGVGMAIAQAHIAQLFNEKYNLVDNYIYVFCGDGCLMEGVSLEAISLAGHLGLEKLIIIYDDNKITIDGSTDLAFTQNMNLTFESCGWHVIQVNDGDSNLLEIKEAISKARSISGKPKLIKLRTTIGYTSKQEGTKEVHGSPISLEDLQFVKLQSGFPKDKAFYVPENVYQKFALTSERGQNAHNQWRNLYAKFAQENPEKAVEFEQYAYGRLPNDWQTVLPKWTPEKPAIATRQASFEVLNALAPVLKTLIGGSADLTPSNLTNLKCSGDFKKDNHKGRYIRFGVREHGMAAIGNGITLYSGLIPYLGTFLNFVGYAAGAVRVGALSELGVIYVGTHDSIGLGEDGPTHQPIEIIASLRAMPHVHVFRPADPNEVSGAYLCAIEDRKMTSVIALTRQAVPNLINSSAENVRKGAYVIHDCENVQAILLATGSEVSICIDVAKQSKDIAIRVVSFPCWSLFERQSEQYKRSVLLEGVPIVSVEAAAMFGWERYSHHQIGMKTFGASGPAKDLYEYFGLTVKNILAETSKVVNFFRSQQTHVPDVLRRF
eukprot:TRINITY_DN807_c0_g1_i1.p1 TRINITY_DN807_c0_g1~~TRINITY_DN807_c0_g1_i1.p1  ORF type:complete len:1002 (-),score=513.60 TRINITY_DN807_c0_g1_i1:74-3079(-)